MYRSDSISINSSLGSYSVFFQRFDYNQLKNVEKSLIMLDKNFANVAEISKSEIVIEIEPGEGSKDITKVAKVMASLAEKGATKDTKILAIGGGTVQDLATFVSSTYMRGIEWSFYPTTLQAMADSCIGGKSAINVGAYKNLMGNYHPPQEVFVDASLILTLTQEDLTCGLLEAIKIAYAGGEDSTHTMLNLIAELQASESKLPEIYEDIIAVSLKAKKLFIEQDEFDLNVRKLLNFGHTYGHAIEAATDYNIHHGLAIGLGMLASFFHSENKSRTLREEEFIIAVQKLLEPFSVTLKDEISSIKQESFYRFIQLDKKSSSENIRFIHSNSGSLEIVALPNNSTTLRNAFKSVIEATNAI